ncbi:MAG: hypothetical protein R3E64_17125 [Halioglobus sp.]
MSKRLELQSLLLLAAFAEPSRALDAWRLWHSQSQWENAVDFDAYLLLPQVYHNLGGRGVEDALFKRLKGVVKRNWLANTATLAAISRIAQVLQANAIASVLLPPHAQLLDDRSMAMQPGAVIAYRIDRSDAQFAVWLLHAQGWRSAKFSVPYWCLPGFIAATNSLRLNADDLALDLQWFESGQQDSHGTASRLFHGQTISTLGTVATIRLLLTAADMGSELVRVTRALLLLHKTSDHAGWRCLLQLLRERESGFADLVASFSPVPAMYSVVTVCKEEAVHKREFHAANDTPATTLWMHYRLRWKAYRAALGDDFSCAAAIRCLPGYLMGKWSLHRLREVFPRWYGTLRYQWRLRHPSRGKPG